jgi:hypothetical protein
MIPSSRLIKPNDSPARSDRQASRNDQDRIEGVNVVRLLGAPPQIADLLA